MNFKGCKKEIIISRQNAEFCIFDNYLINWNDIILDIKNFNITKMNFLLLVDFIFNLLFNNGFYYLNKEYSDGYFQIFAMINHSIWMHRSKFLIKIIDNLTQLYTVDKTSTLWRKILIIHRDINWGMKKKKEYSFIPFNSFKVSIQSLPEILPNHLKFSVSATHKLIKNEPSHFSNCLFEKSVHWKEDYSKANRVSSRVAF